MSPSRSTRAYARAPLIQDVVLSATSAAVVILVAWLLFMPPGVSMAISVESIAASGPITLYGRVIDQDGRPVRGASVVVVRDLDGVQVASLGTAADGTFRTVITGGPGSYRVVASVSVGGRTVRDTTRIDMEPDHTYGVSVELQRRTYFLFLPLPSY